MLFVFWPDEALNHGLHVTETSLKPASNNLSLHKRTLLNSYYKIVKQSKFQNSLLWHANYWQGNVCSKQFPSYPAYSQTFQVSVHYFPLISTVNTTCYLSPSGTEIKPIYLGATQCTPDNFIPNHACYALNHDRNMYVTSVTLLFLQSCLHL